MTLHEKIFTVLDVHRVLKHLANFPNCHNRLLPLIAVFLPRRFFWQFPADTTLLQSMLEMCKISKVKTYPRKLSCFLYCDALQNNEVYAWWKAPVKCFKIYHIFGIQKPTTHVVFLFFISYYFIFSLINALIHVDIDQGIYKGKN